MNFLSFSFILDFFLSSNLTLDFGGSQAMLSQWSLWKWILRTINRDKNCLPYSNKNNRLLYWMTGINWHLYVPSNTRETRRSSIKYCVSAAVSHWQFPLLSPQQSCAECPKKELDKVSEQIPAQLSSQPTSHDVRTTVHQRWNDVKRL